jgi:hypothetical protein
MVTPGIQNEFSYYRRTLNRMKLSKEEANAIKIKDELANRMSLFFAYPTPMMRSLADTTVKCLESGNGAVTKQSVIQGLALMANVCQDMVAKRKYVANAVQCECGACVLTVELQICQCSNQHVLLESNDWLYYSCR